MLFISFCDLFYPIATAPVPSNEALEWVIGILGTVVLGMAGWMTKKAIAPNKTEEKIDKCVLLLEDLSATWGVRGTSSQTANERMLETRHLYKEYEGAQKQKFEELCQLLRSLHEMHNVKDTNGVYIWWVTSAVVRDIADSQDRITQLIQNLVQIISNMKKE